MTTQNTSLELEQAERYLDEIRKIEALEFPKEAHSIHLAAAIKNKMTEMAAEVERLRAALQEVISVTAKPGHHATSPSGHVYYQAVVGLEQIQRWQAVLDKEQSK